LDGWERGWTPCRGISFLSECNMTANKSDINKIFEFYDSLKTGHNGNFVVDLDYVMLVASFSLESCNGLSA
jgi:hypothetical protein